jgi:predicted ArsR family transcriptional regulator
MDIEHSKFLADTHLKFSKFKELSEQSGPEKAWEKMLEGFPEQQQHRMSPFIANATLAEGFSKAIPFFKSVGMEMEVVDISNNKMDAALEIQKYCPYLDISKEYGFETPCHVICELDVEATRRAFPEMKGEILSRQAFGSCVCLFKYERVAT